MRYLDIMYKRTYIYMYKWSLLLNVDIASYALEWLNCADMYVASL